MDDSDWLDAFPTNGTTTTEADTITVTIDRTGLQLSNYGGRITVTSNGGNQNIDVYMETAVANSTLKSLARAILMAMAI